MKQWGETPPFTFFLFVNYIMITMPIWPSFPITFKLEELIPKYIDFVRLHECVELLKDMETKGLLDMSKVHASFWLLLDILFFNIMFFLHAYFLVIGLSC